MCIVNQSILQDEAKGGVARQLFGQNGTARRSNSLHALPGVKERDEYHSSMGASRQAYVAGEQEGLNVSLDIFKSSLTLLSALERVAADALAATGGSASPRQAIVHVPVNAAYVAEVCRNAREKFTAARGHLVDMESRVLQHSGSLKQPVMPPAAVASLLAPPMPNANQMPLQPIPPRLAQQSSTSSSQIGGGHPPLQPPRKLSSSEVQESPLTNRLRASDNSMHSFRHAPPGPTGTPFGGGDTHMMDTELAHAETRRTDAEHTKRATTPTHGSPPPSIQTSPKHGGKEADDGGGAYDPPRPGDAPPAEDDGSAYKGDLPPLNFTTIAARVQELAAAVRLRIAPAPSLGPSRNPTGNGDFSDDDASQGGGPVSPSMLLGSPPPRQLPAASPWTGRPGSSRSDAFRAETPPHRRASVVPFEDNAGGLKEGLTPAAGNGQGGFNSAADDDSDGDEAAQRARRTAQLPPGVALAVPLGMLGVPPWSASLLRDAEIDAAEHCAELAQHGTGPGTLQFAPSAGGGGVPRSKGGVPLEPGMPLAQAFRGVDEETGDALALFVGLDGTMGSSICRAAVEYSAYMHVAWRAASGPARELLLLLQAMRWRITRSAAGRARDDALRALVSADALGCTAAQAALRRVSKEDTQTALEALARAGVERGGAGQVHGTRSGVPAAVSAVAQCSLVSALLGCGHPLVVDSATRLVNCMASTPAARAYLLQDPNIVPCFTRVLLLQAGDTTTRQNVVGALQKMSTAQVPQDIMIRTGVMPWALRVLREHHAPVAADAAGAPLGGVSLYSLQYTAALITTMAQRVAGRRSAAAAPAGALETLMDYLGGPAAEVGMFAAAAVYSLLANKGLLAHARVIGLPEVLQALAGRVPEEHLPGLQFVLTRLEEGAVDSDEEGGGGGKEGGGDETDVSDGEGYDSDGAANLTAWLSSGPSGSAHSSAVNSPTSQGTSTWEAEDGDEGDAVVATVLDTWGEALLKAAASAAVQRHQTPLPVEGQQGGAAAAQAYTPSTLGSAAVGPGTPVPRSQVDFGAAAAGAVRRVRSRSILGSFDFISGNGVEGFTAGEEAGDVQLQPAPVPARDALGLTVVHEMSDTQETDSRRSSQARNSRNNSQRGSLSGASRDARPALPGLIRHSPAISPGTRGGGRRGSAAAFSSLMDAESGTALFKPRHALARSPRA